MSQLDKIDIVFDGPPSHESGRFVKVEDMNGCSVNVGEWIDRKDGYWALRISLKGEEYRKKCNVKSCNNESVISSYCMKHAALSEEFWT